MSTSKHSRVGIIHVSRWKEFATGLTNLLVEKILLAKLCKWTEKLTSNPDSFFFSLRLCLMYKVRKFSSITEWIYIIVIKDIVTANSTRRRFPTGLLHTCHYMSLNGYKLGACRFYYFNLFILLLID